MNVGILGGGQLGRMLAIAGVPLGVRCVFLDPDPAAPAAAVGTHIVGDYDDPVSLDALASSVRVCTYEFENVPASAVDHLIAHGMIVHPSRPALATAQDRRLEKEAFVRLGIPTPKYAAIDPGGDIGRACEQVGLPGVIKTCRGGYDGKGQAVVRTQSEARAAAESFGPVALILEQLVSFDRELSMLAVRGREGEHAAYPVVQNHHVGGILRESDAPAPAVTDAMQTQAADYAARLMDHFDYVGVMALEMFDVGGSLWANEIAPRVHNSGHWTIEGALTSQFENHLRAVVGWPLGSTASRGASVMLNLIGRAPPIDALLACEGARVHLYGKAPKPGRKIGHVTICAADVTTANALAEPVRALILESQAG